MPDILARTQDGRDQVIRVIDYEVSEDSTPLAPGDTSGGVGSITFNALMKGPGDGPRSSYTGTLTDETIVLEDGRVFDGTPFEGRGVVSARVTSVSQAGARVQIAADTYITRLNVERTAKPFYGIQRTNTIVSTRTNYATNPSFETATTNVVAVPGTGGAGTLTRPLTGGLFGVACVRYAWTTATTAAGGGLYYRLATPVINARYTNSLYVRVNKATPPPTGQPAQRLVLQIEYYNGAALISSVLSNEITVGYQAWTRLSVDGIVPTGTTEARVRVKSTAGTYFSQWAVGDYIEVDGVLIELSSDDNVGTYFDGTTAGATWTGTAHASTSILTSSVTTTEGYNATVANAFRYYCSLVGISEATIDVEPAFETIPVAIPAWTGNVWDYIKQFCAAFAAEVAVINDRVTLRKPRQHVIPVEFSNSFDVEVNSQHTALGIEVYNYNSHWGSDEVAFEAATVYTVDKGEYSRIEVKSAASLGRVNNPIMVSVINPNPYIGGTGQYAVIDSDGRSVDPAWWARNGGSVTAELDAEDPNNILINIFGPTTGNEYTAPFRIAQNTSDEFPALVITGEGVFTDKQPMFFLTGASSALTSAELAPTIDNVFLGSTPQTFDRGMIAAGRASGPVVTITGTIPYDAAAHGQEFGIVPGARIYVHDNIYRVRQVQYGVSGMRISAEADMTFNDLLDMFAMTFNEFNAIYAGQTFASFNTLVGAITFAQFNAGSAGSTFNAFNVIYDGMAFKDFTVYPRLTTLETDSATA